MFKLKINDRDYLIPTDWSNLPWKNYIKALNAQKLASPDEYANINVISALSGISGKLIRLMLSSQRDLLISLLHFYWDDEIPMNPINEKISGIDIGLQSWDKLNRCSMEFEAIANAEIHEWAAAHNVCRIYTEKNEGGFFTKGIDLNSMSVVDALPYAAFFLISSKTGLKRTQHFMMMNRTKTRMQQALRIYKPSSGLVHLSDLQKAIQSSTISYLSSLRSISTERFCTSITKRNITKNCEAFRK